MIQIRNNYDKGTAGVFNGTVGTITALSVTEQQLTVRTDEDEDIVYDFDELDELQHAYAITVHRSQGSEYPAVVVPLTMSAYTLLQRNLLYTAVTRAKRLVVLVGSRKALAIAVRTAGTGRRHTALTHRLQKPERDQTLIVTPAARAAGHLQVPRAAPARAGTRGCPPPPITGHTMARWPPCSRGRLRGAGGPSAGEEIGALASFLRPSRMGCPGNARRRARCRRHSRALVIAAHLPRRRGERLAPVAHQVR